MEISDWTPKLGAIFSRTVPKESNCNYFAYRGFSGVGVLGET
jgi:hypothetical protein